MFNFKKKGTEMRSFMEKKAAGIGRSVGHGLKNLLIGGLGAGAVYGGARYADEKGLRLGNQSVVKDAPVKENIQRTKNVVRSVIPPIKTNIGNAFEGASLVSNAIIKGIKRAPSKVNTAVDAATQVAKKVVPKASTYEVMTSDEFKYLTPSQKATAKVLKGIGSGIGKGVRAAGQGLNNFLTTWSKNMSDSRGTLR